MEKNKIRTYFLYAIGEIALVMIGILLALQVNNWNQERQKRTEETYYLEKLIENLEADSAIVQELITAQSNMVIMLDSALYMMVNKHAFEAGKFNNHLNAMLGVSTFTQNSVTYDNLIASGKISYITDQQLINALFAYYDPGNEFMIWDDALRDYTRNIFGPFIFENYYLTSGGLNAGSLNKNYAQLEKPELSYEEFRGNQQLLNNLNMKYRIVTAQRQLYTESVAPMQSDLLHLLRANRIRLEN